MADVKNLKELFDWNKWIITINLTGATGCIIAFIKNPPTFGLKALPILLAIVIFIVSILIAVINTLRLLIASPGIKDYHAAGWRQVYLFMAGLIALFFWISVKLFTPAGKEQIIQVLKPDGTVTVTSPLKP